MTELRSALAAYDGKHTDLLESLRDRVEPRAAVLRQCVDLATDPDARLAAGATWLLRAWVEAGRQPSPGVMARLARALPAVQEHWARLHLCQTVRSLRVPRAHAAAFAAFLGECRLAKKPFLRAWAIDGLHRLALDHPAHEPAARAALEAGLADPAASVRARVRRIQAGD
ncbi:MAG: hypothetical protein NXI31_08380 [bacterium]|nr:hypothetical protein [bacterium]